jgi:hypothetical protein
MLEISMYLFLVSVKTNIATKKLHKYKDKKDFFSSIC